MGRISTAKEKLLEVAFELIWDQSYGSVSVDDICQRAEVKKGSFYHFFESKADLAVAAYEEHWRAKQPEMDRIFSSQIPPLDRLTNWAQFIYEGQKQKAGEHGHVCGCPYASIGSELATQDDKIRLKCEEMLGRMLRYLECAIAEAKRDGLVDCSCPKAAANQVGSFIMGAMMQAKIQNDVEVLKNLGPTILAIIGEKRAVEAVTT
jgi:TetR/AcrR family transcriptional repressor of nem operon